ncbi:hypothetical protein EON65_59260 [archaeon]|nr:MAG: hypothetical protein EON65_59260 [archaeon]
MECSGEKVFQSAPFTSTHLEDSREYYPTMTTVLNACCSILGSSLPGGDIAVLLCCVSLYACCVYIHDYDVAYRLLRL